MVVTPGDRHRELNAWADTLLEGVLLKPNFGGRHKRRAEAKREDDDTRAKRLRARRRELRRRKGRR